ncbi:hypothetical protein D3C81_1471880 [compost metagenome]
MYEAEIQPGLLVWQLLYENRGDLLSRDNIKLLQLALDQTRQATSATIAQATIKSILGPFGETEANAINSYGDWHNHVRKSLATEPQESDAFCDDFRMAFPRLKFSDAFPQCIDTFEGGYKRHSIVLVHCLSALNDHWQWDGGDLTQYLRAFSTQSSISTTQEGNGSRKPALTFSFKSIDGRSENVLCEPHMKLTQSDVAGDSTFYFHRIYFYPRSHATFEGQLLIGHAGEHL